MRDRLIIKASGPLIAVLMMAIDGFGVVVVLPTIQGDLDTSFAALQWVLSAYLLAVAVSVILVGRFGDIFGRRLLLISTMAIFAVGSLICGFAPNDIVLIVGRAVQGVGGAGLYVLSLSLMTASAPKEKMASAIGLWATMAGIGMALGPIGYGLLVDLIDWRAVFLLNVPIMVVGIVLSWVFLDESSDPDAKRQIDVPGVALMTGGTLMLMIGVIQADSWGWQSPLTIGLIVLSAVPLVAFWFVERRAEVPLIELDVFARNLRFLGANAALFGFFFALYAFPFVVAIFLQDIQGFSATEAALRLLPWPIAFVITAQFVPKVIKRHGGAGPLIFGSLGLALAVLLISFADANTSDAVLMGIFAFFGISQAFGAIAIVGAILGSVPRTKVGAASGARATVSYISGSLGVAVVGAVLLVRERSELSEITEESGRRLTREEQQEIDGVLAGSEEAEDKLDDFPPLEADQITEAAGQAFTAGLETSMRVAAAAVVIGLIGYVALTRRAEHRDPGPVGHPGAIPLKKAG